MVKEGTQKGNKSIQKYEKSNVRKKFVCVSPNYNLWRSRSVHNWCGDKVRVGRISVLSPAAVIGLHVFWTGIGLQWANIAFWPAASFIPHTIY